MNGQLKRIFNNLNLNLMGIKFFMNEISQWLSTITKNLIRVKFLLNET